MRRAYRAATAVFVLLGGCAVQAGPTTASSVVGSSTAPSVATTSQETVPSFQAVSVAVASGPLGDYLVDGSGRSLYMFALDDERTSTCVDACADRWPPLLGNAERVNGAIQVTYSGHPLYYYTVDAVPGDTKGQGFNDVWFLVSPSGEPLTG